MTLQARTSLTQLVTVAALFMPPPAGAQGQSERPIEAYWYCYTSPRADPIYVTPVWEARAAPDDVIAAFKKMVAARYQYDGPFSCPGAKKAYHETTLAKIQNDAKAMFANYAKQGKKIVETDWTPAGTALDPGNASEGASPTASATYWSVCQVHRYSKGNGPYDVYISDVFPMNQTDHGKQSAAFAAFLSSRYGPARDAPQCNIYPSEAPVRDWLKRWTDAAAKAGSKVTMTGWKFVQ